LIHWNSSVNIFTQISYQEKPIKKYFHKPRPRKIIKPFRVKSKDDKYRINEQIRVPQVLLIDENGKRLGVIRTQEALARAKTKEMDLVEVSPIADPPVCKILSYGKFKYEQRKKEKEQKKKTKQKRLKIFKFKPKIEEGDKSYRIKRAAKKAMEAKKAEEKK